MLTTDTLTLMSQVTRFIKTGSGEADSTVPFGGMNVLLMGDFHQFPPVGNPCTALHSSPTFRKLEPLPKSVGHNIYSQFGTVVTLVQQQWIMDRIEMDILARVRTGDCTLHNLLEIQKLVLIILQCELPDPNTPPWDDVVLITPRMLCAKDGNEACLWNHC